MKREDYFTKRRRLELAVGKALEDNLFNVFTDKTEQDRARVDIGRYIIGYLGIRKDWTV